MDKLFIKIMLTLLSDKINKILNILFIFFLLKYYTFIIKNLILISLSNTFYNLYKLIIFRVFLNKKINHKNNLIINNFLWLI